MAFSGKVQDGAWAVLGQKALCQAAVTQVALHEDVARVTLQAGKIFQISSIG